MIFEARTIATEGQSLDLDPFAFWPDISSRLEGFGGNEVGNDPDYVFHSLYVSCGAGPIVFTLCVTGLKADRGTLILRVHELPEVMGAHARQVAISQTQLTELIRAGGTVSLASMARLGHHYALLGHIYGDTRANAETLAIEIARRTPSPADPSLPTKFRASSRRVAEAPQIVGEHEGTLITPVSQLCTAAQFAEPIFDATLNQLGGGLGRSLVDQWERVFLARVFDRYDVARSGARGAGIGALDASLISWLSRHGCSTAIMSAADLTAEPGLPLIEELEQEPQVLAEAGNVDFVWIARSCGVGSTDRQGVLRILEDALRILKPGGLLAAVLPIEVANEPRDGVAALSLRRPDIDRLVLLLLSRGHQVAQISPWGEAVVEEGNGANVGLSAFGLIVRRAA